MSEAVKAFKAKVKELAAFVESNEADSYLTEEFLARLTELRELTKIIKIDMANIRRAEAPMFSPSIVYVPEAPKENLTPVVVEEVSIEAPKAKVEKKEVIVEPVAKTVVEAEQPVVEEVNAANKESSSEAGTEAQTKAIKPRAAKA